MTQLCIFDPSASYLVLGEHLDVADALAFSHRMKTLRDVVSDMVLRHPVDDIEPLLLDHNPSDFEATLESEHLADPFFAQLSVAVHQPKKGPKTVTIHARRKGFAIRRMEISEPAMSDGSNVPSLADIKARGGLALLPIIDRWIALSENRIWLGDDKLRHQTQVLMQVIYAHLQATKSPIAESDQLAFRVGPYRSVQLVPGEWRSEIFSTYEYLTPAGVEALTAILPAMSRLQCEIKSDRLIYEIKEFYLLEEHQMALTRNPGNAIDTMRSLRAFPDCGPLLRDDLERLAA